MNYLIQLTEQQVSAFQYFLDTLYGAVMLFIFAQVSPKVKNILSFGILVLCSYSLVLCTILFKNVANIGFFYTLFVHIPFILFFILVFKKKTIVVLIAHFLIYSILSSRYFFGNLFKFLFSFFGSHIQEAIATRIGWIVSAPFLVIASIYLFGRRFPLLGSEDRTEQRLLLGSLGLAYIVIQILHISSLFQNQIEILLLSFIFFILLYSFLLSVCFYSSIIKEAEIIKTQNTAYSLQTEGLFLLNEAITNYLESTARLRHDQRHLLNILDSHANKGDLSAIKRLINKNLEVINASPQRVTGDEIIDSILTLFIKRASEFKIHIEIQGSSLLEIPISHDDLSLLLSNSLENAINATQLVSEDYRQVLLNVTKNKDTGTIALLIQNPCVNPVTFSQDGLPQSLRGETHGYGTRSMRLIVSKYNGLCSFSTEENFFIFRAVFFHAQKIKGD